MTSAILPCSSVSIDALSGMLDADAIVVGAGAAGMMGALAAAQRGAAVLLLEKDLAGPSNLLVSGGLFPGAGTRWQRAAGIDDSGPAFARDIRAKGGATTNETIVEAIAARTADAAHFLADAAGIDVHLAATISAPGHAVARLHATPAESGRELHALMRAAVAREKRIEVVDRVEILGLDAAFTVKTQKSRFAPRPCCSAPAASPATPGCCASSSRKWRTPSTSAPGRTTAAPSRGAARSARRWRRWTATKARDM